MEIIKKGKEDIDKTQKADYWLWDYHRWYERTRKRWQQHAKKDKYREIARLGMRRLRLRGKAEPRNSLISAVYWHEVNYPGVPIRAFK